MPLTPITCIVLLIGLIACATDLHRRRIPNLLTLGAAIAALVYQVAAGGVDGLLTAAGGWAVGVAIFFLPFALGGLGAGDVKLVAAIGAWLGPAETVWLGLYAAIAGGVLAIAVALSRGYLRVALANVRLLLTHWRVNGLTPLKDISLDSGTGPRLAYAIPIFIGTVVTLWLR